MSDEVAWRLLRGVGQLVVIHHRYWMRMTTRDEVGGGYGELEQVERVVEKEFEVGVGAGAGVEVVVEVEAGPGLEKDTSNSPMAGPDADAETCVEGEY
jgi:hypothetical protein